ncbi:manganese catalase family protein [Xanthomonas arboricola]|uniref:Manganese catalase family protein n=4 Tax=Xanthomonas arboricola pv. pruni TaxID=69929 RepID=A0AAP4KAI1_9XANT|nr:manganese catalase family protein [Xanthomonas arboricola]KCX00293.1 Mn-containing catalase [Xanthomonas arboricola pv. pruni]KPN11777.1 Mn-containing catalase [Xanthomonas arboricola pv. pruni]MDN0267068.1 manganese catalase family protein [Xanthomonas arboricola pv. pruni]MDN0271026.1 manganese catalase family protein [Xanthomonas arboricola pv. pruni]MDN0275367.1 manganese catalase family protein [Xanthomonas arboricola pv. pruni]
MFMHNKRLMYTVRVAGPNPDLATLMLEQFGGPQGELAAAMQYFTQALGEDDPGRKDLLFDIATEELSHLEIIGSIIAMLNKGPKAVLSEGMEEAMEMRSMTQNSTSHTQQILYGGGPALVNSSGVPWTSAYVDSIGCPTSDMRSNIAAEARAKLVYERLITVTDDPGIVDALRFLMTREVAHQKSFEKALYSIEPNFPPGKLPGDPRFTDIYYDMSQGEGDTVGPWNAGEQWDVVADRELQSAVDGGDGSATVALDATQTEALDAMSLRLLSNPELDRVTGADLGAGPGAGSTTGDIQR